MKGEDDLILPVKGPDDQLVRFDRIQGKVVNNNPGYIINNIMHNCSYSEN